MRHARCAAATASAVVLALGLAGCGGSEEPTTKASASTSPSSASPSPSATASSPSPSPTPTARPLSPFEGRPVVKVSRRWAAAYAKSINADDRSMRALRPVVTGDPARFAASATQEFGLYYPGPVPFTPTAVQTTGGTSTVRICLQSGGWGQKRSTKLPATKRRVIPAQLILRKTGGAWKVDGFYSAKGSCSGVAVKGVAG